MRFDSLPGAPLSAVLDDFLTFLTSRPEKYLGSFEVLLGPNASAALAGGEVSQAPWLFGLPIRLTRATDHY